MALRARISSVIAGASVVVAGALSFHVTPSAQAVSGGSRVITSKPWAVQVLRDGRRFCSGALISPHWILTAAHCVNGVEWNRVTVLVGSLDTGRGTARAARFIRINPHYDGGHRSDIALIGLYTSTGNTRVPLGGDVAVGEQVTMFGYGRLSDGTPSPSLRAATNTVFGRFGTQFGVHGDLGATGTENVGDSGAPWLDAGGRLVGIVDNTDVDCATVDNPRVGSGPTDGPGGTRSECLAGKTTAYAASVAHARQWIRSVSGV